MLWASELLGRDGKPAVLLLAAQRRGGTITAELAYVAATPPTGPLAGRYWRSLDSAPDRVTLHWVGAWPDVTPGNRLHPRNTTPPEAVTHRDEQTLIQLTIVIEGASIL